MYITVHKFSKHKCTKLLHDKVKLIVGCSLLTAHCSLVNQFGKKVSGPKAINYRRH